jgi:hypothetical protein
MPILYAERSHSVNPEDTGWQFLCNSGRPEDADQAQVWSLGEVLAREPSVRSFLNAPAGTRVSRTSDSLPWEKDSSTVH